MSMSPRTALRCIALALSVTLVALPALGADDPESQGDAAWSNRAQGAHGAKAAPGPIDEAISAYRKAVEANPEDLELYTKLLRALYFKGEYVAQSDTEKQKIFDDGRKVFEKAQNLLAKKVGGRSKLDAMSPKQVGAAFPDQKTQVASIYFWGAGNWARWGVAFGRMAAARQGVAERVRDEAKTVIELDPGYHGAGGYRLLGRLMEEVPKIPFITGWVDPKQGLADLRKANSIAPDNPMNQLFLAEALLKEEPKAHAEAKALLEKVANLTPRADSQVEDAWAQAKAKAELKTLG